MKISVSKAVAQANGFGFPKTQARPKAPSSQSLARLGPAFFRLASGLRPSRHITNFDTPALSPFLHTAFCHLGHATFLHRVKFW